MKKRKDSLQRRSRIRPQSTGKRVTLQSRDWLWLEKLHRHGPLASSYLLEFAQHLGRSEKRAKERLTDLFNENNTAHGGPYLSRPPQQFQTIDSRYNQLIYDLAPAGISALKMRGVWCPRNRSSGGPWLHGFMVSSITSSIELAPIERTDLNFIAQSEILNRADAELSYPVDLIDPATKRRVHKSLQPDALFGISYRTAVGSRFRFFVVEADRATEPLTSTNFNRKSALRILQAYQSYAGAGLYKKHLSLTAPLLVLNVFSHRKRTEKTMALLNRLVEGGLNYQLYQSWEAFASPFRVPQPNPTLLNGAWSRATQSSIRL